MMNKEDIPKWDMSKAEKITLKDRDFDRFVENILKANPVMSRSVCKRLKVQTGIEFDADGKPKESTEGDIVKE